MVGGQTNYFANDTEDMYVTIHNGHNIGHFYISLYKLQLGLVCISAENGERHQCSNYEDIFPLVVQDRIDFIQCHYIFITLDR